MLYGHVDGHSCRKTIETGAGESVTFEIGNSATFSPVTMDFPDAGGTTGAALMP